MVERFLRIEGDSSFGTDDSGIVLLQFVVGLGEKQMNLAVAGILRRSSLQELRRFCVLPGVVGLVGGFEAVVALHARCCVRVLESRREEKRGEQSNLNRIHFGHERSSHRYW